MSRYKYKPDDRVLLKDAVPPQAGMIIERAFADEDGDWLLSRDGSGGSVVRYESELMPLQPPPAKGQKHIDGAKWNGKRWVGPIQREARG